MQVGNGDVVSVQAAVDLLQATKCDGIMIGRGALQDPLLFSRIRAHFSNEQQNHQKATTAHSASHSGSTSGFYSGTSSTGREGQQGLHASEMQQQQQDCSRVVQHPEHTVIEAFLTTYASYGFDGTVDGAEQLVSCAHSQLPTTS
jgi:tRNA-dihydrouridine synthase